MNSEQFVCQCYRPTTDSWLQVELPSELVTGARPQRYPHCDSVGRVYWPLASSLPATIVDWIIKEFNGQWIPKDMTHGFEEVS